jgi:hypothetical protein
MGSYMVLGSVVVVTLALISDFNGTVSLVTMVITVKGITFVVRKIVDSFNREHGEIINFVGNCLAGISCVGLIKNAMEGVKPVMNILGKVGNFINGVGSVVDRVGEFIQGLPF